MDWWLLHAYPTGEEHGRSVVGKRELVFLFDEGVEGEILALALLRENEINATAVLRAPNEHIRQGRAFGAIDTGAGGDKIVAVIGELALLRLAPRTTAALMGVFQRHHMVCVYVGATLG